MAIKVLELHHHGIRIGPSPDEVKRALDFYHDVVGPQSQPLFMYDPFGTMIELHQIDSRRCVVARRSNATTRSMA
jgi:hypothetical protein